MRPLRASRRRVPRKLSSFFLVSALLVALPPAPAALSGSSNGHSHGAAEALYVGRLLALRGGRGAAVGVGRGGLASPLGGRGAVFGIGSPMGGQRVIRHTGKLSSPVSQANIQGPKGERRSARVTPELTKVGPEPRPSEEGTS